MKVGAYFCSETSPRRLFVSFVPLMGAVVLSAAYLCILIASGISKIPSGLSDLLAVQVPVESMVLPYAKDAIYRITWAIFALAASCSVFLSVAVSWITLKACLFDRFPAKRTLLIAHAMCGGAVIWVGVFYFGLSGGLGELLYDYAEANSRPPLNGSHIMDVLMANAAVAIWFVVLACCALCHFSFQTDKESQLLLSKMFKCNLGATGLLLCLGILQTFALYKWLSSFIRDAEAARLILSGMTFSVSFFYTTFFVAVFLPAYIAYREGAFRWASLAAAEREKTPRDILKENGFMFSPGHYLKVASVMSSPLVVGLLTELVRL